MRKEWFVEYAGSEIREVVDAYEAEYLTEAMKIVTFV